MQNPNFTPTNILWLSACSAALLWFLYWIFYDLIIWGKDLVQVNPLNYYGVALALTFMLLSGLGMRKIESVCYLGSTAAFLWFGYWISYDLLVWNKSLLEINVTNYVGVGLSLILVFVPKLTSFVSKRQEYTHQTVIAKNGKSQKRTSTTKRTRKYASAAKKAVA